METDFNRPIFQKQEQAKVIRETAKLAEKQTANKPVNRVPSIKIPSIGDLKFSDDKPGRMLNKIRNWLPLILVGLVVLLAVWVIFREVIARWF